MSFLVILIYGFMLLKSECPGIHLTHTGFLYLPFFLQYMYNIWLSFQTRLLTECLISNQLIWDLSFSASWFISWPIVESSILAYFCVILRLEWPSIFETLSIEIWFARVTVVAKVCLAQWVLRFFVMPHKSAISFRYAFIFWFESTGNRTPFLWLSGVYLYFSIICLATGSSGMCAHCLD